MPKFLFQPDALDGYEFYPILIVIQLGIVRIPTKEIFYDDAINNTKMIVVGSDREEVLNRIQTTFSREFQRYGKLKESDIRPMDYETGQAWQELENI